MGLDHYCGSIYAILSHVRCVLEHFTESGIPISDLLSRVDTFLAVLCILRMCLGNTGDLLALIHFICEHVGNKEYGRRTATARMHSSRTYTSSYFISMGSDLSSFVLIFNCCLENCYFFVWEQYCEFNRYGKLILKHVLIFWFLILKLFIVNSIIV
jgi:hypothetical protein